MRPNLSLESIAGALAVLGTGVIMAACGGEDPKTPVNANEVSGATEKAADGANHCGAGKDHKAGQASCSADKAGGDAKPADTTPAAATPAAATPAAATPAAATPAAATPDPKAATPAPASTTGKKPAAPATPAKKGGSGSCGAGTCSAKK
jgi:hypothetical protein